MLVYSANTSFDGYTVDSAGGFDWSVPTDEVHAAINDLERRVTTYLYGRRMYETMAVWQEFGDDESAVVRDYARVWRSADKVVYSATLDAVGTPRTRLERAFDPADVARLVRETHGPVSIGGATIAASALRAGLVDEIHQFASPVIVGGGTRFLPDGVRFDLELVDVRTFANGVVHSHYRRRA